MLTVTKTIKELLSDLCEDRMLRGAVRDNSVVLAAIILATEISNLGETIRSLENVLRTDHPLMGETFTEISSSLADIAQAIEKKA